MQTKPFSIWCGGFFTAFHFFSMARRHPLLIYKGRREELRNKTNNRFSVKQNRDYVTNLNFCDISIFK